MSLLRFVVYSNLFIACAAALQVASFIPDHAGEERFPLIIFVFSATLFVYCAQRLGGKTSRVGRTIRFHWMQKFRSVLFALSVVAVLLMGFALPFLPLEVIMISIALGILSMLYAWRPSNKSPLREMGWIKLSAVSLVWALAVVALFPLVENGFSAWLDKQLWCQVAERFCFLFILTLPFDIRDMEQDPNRVHTLPRSLGLNASKWLGTGIGLVGLAIGISGLHPDVWGIPTFTYTLALILLWYSVPNRRSEMYYSVLIDGLLVVDAVCRLVA